jgi:hypothetical protein
LIRILTGYVRCKSRVLSPLVHNLPSYIGNPPPPFLSITCPFHNLLIVKAYFYRVKVDTSWMDESAPSVRLASAFFRPWARLRLFYRGDNAENTGAIGGCDFVTIDGLLGLYNKKII